MSDPTKGEAATGSLTHSIGQGVETLRVVVTGLVQGVGYRFFVEDTARQTGVTGSVRNRPDGRVSILVQGRRDALDAFLSRITAPEPPAWVREVDVRHARPDPSLRCFRAVPGSAIAEVEDGFGSLAVVIHRMSEDLRGMVKEMRSERDVQGCNLERVEA